MPDSFFEQASLVELKSLSLEELTQFVTERLGESPYRAEQIFTWLHRGAESFDEMSNLSKAMRDKLSALSIITVAKIEKKLVSEQDGTVKYLWRLSDGACVESVFMSHRHGDSLCISTQVGCKMGCGFCASTLGGLVRNLTAGEILDQVLFTEKDMGKRPSSLVLMGIGEPLDNYEQVLRFLKNLSDPKGYQMSLRHVSLSTCGIVPMMKKLERENLGLTLSVSLHAPNDLLRSRLMPVNKKWGVDALLSACKDYAKATGRRISFEYILIKGVNDTPECARELAKKLSGLLCHVNLILANPVPERGMEPSEEPTVRHFMNILKKHRINNTLRRKLGEDINAACGQLRRANAL